MGSCEILDKIYRLFRAGISVIRKLSRKVLCMRQPLCLLQEPQWLQYLK